MPTGFGPTPNLFAFHRRLRLCGILSLPTRPLAKMTRLKGFRAIPSADKM